MRWNNDKERSPETGTRPSARPRPRRRPIWVLTAALAIAALAFAAWVLVGSGHWRTHQRMLDAWALHLELEPMCDVGGAPASTGADRARLALARETLALIDELLGDPRPMSPVERDRRTDRYAQRLSDAVSERLGAEAVADSEEVPLSAPAPESGVARAEPVRDAPLARAAEPVPAGLREAPPAAEAAEPERIVIRSASGESWADIRDRRARERGVRAASWRPIAARELGPVIELRRLLARDLEGDSLAGATGRCARLGIAAGEADPRVVREAPDRVSRGAVARMLEAYETAGHACSTSNYTLAFVALDDGDGAWKLLREGP